MGYDPRLKVLSLTRVLDTGVVNEPVAIKVQGNTMIVDRQISKKMAGPALSTTKSSSRNRASGRSASPSTQKANGCAK